MELVETLSRTDCLRLLGEHVLGRVAYTERALPSIRSMRYALVGRHLVLSTSAEEFAARLDGQVVAFAIDDADTDPGYGWSVVVTGRVSRLLEPRELLPASSKDPSGAELAAVVLAHGSMRGRRVVRDGRPR